MNTAIVGAQGYSGLELAKLLLAHPHAELDAVFSRDSSWQLQHDLPLNAAKQVPTHHTDNLLQHLDALDCVFLATPPAPSMQLVPQLLEQDITVIDLSGAFRLPAASFEDWYGEAHTAQEYLAQATYGLCPWWQPTGQEKLISNPGCYATCALMSLLPLLKSQLINPHNITIDAKSGVSGAGRTAKQPLLFAELIGDFYPYKIGKHQHQPEINFYCEQFAATNTAINLFTHLLPVKRGIMMTLITQLSDGVSVENILQAYHAAYQHYSLINVGLVEHKTVSLNKVVNSAHIDIALHICDQQLIIFAAIDNLLKGAASQAIENFNLLNNLPISTSLEDLS